MDPAVATGNAPLTIALALAIGLIAQSIAVHLRIPGIVILLAAGVLLGPDLAGLIQPSSLGSAMPALIGFAVAVILFEGGMNLNIERLRREGRAIRQLITLGALVTAVGGTLVAKLILAWGWRPSILFGALVIVTGPTVITPLLRRFKVEHKVSTVLEAEGVLIDAIGAVVAVVALEVAAQPSGTSFALGAFHVGAKLLVGCSFGLVGGWLLGKLLQLRNLVPDGLQNVFTLSLVLALYQGAELVMHESGIAAVTAAGLVVGNMRTHVHHELREFKEQLTVMLIGMLFILLAADVRLFQVKSLGLVGLVAVAALVFVVRPMNVLAGTWGSDLDWRRKLFIAWIGPRGIIAAAIASFFAAALKEQGVPGGDELQAMVFLVIAVTVVFSGLTGGWLAGVLGLRRPPNTGWVLLGANELGQALARVLQEGGEDVVLVDANDEVCLDAKQHGFNVLSGNALEERTLVAAGIETRLGVLGVTPNDEVNLLFIQKALEAGPVRHRLAAVHRPHQGATADMVREAGASVLFGRPVDTAKWSALVERGDGVLQTWFLKEPADDLEDLLEDDRVTTDLFVLLTVRRGKKVFPFSNLFDLRDGDEATMVINEPRAEEAQEWLQEHGWERIEPPPESSDEPPEGSAASPSS